MGKINLEKVKKQAIQIIDRDYSYIDGKFLRNLRMSLNMSQSLLAEYFGVSKKAIEKWEQGKNKINAPVVRLIFLIENNPEILSMLKEVRVSNEVITLKRTAYVIENKGVVSTNAVSKESQTWETSVEWEYSTENKKMGGYSYA